MSQFLNGPGNYSLYTVVGAWTLAIAPHFYGIALHNSKLGEWDNSNPRGNLAVLGKEITPENAKIVARIQRAEAAQQNGFENLGFFAASIVAGNIAKLPPATLNKLAFGYLATRAAYNVIYINTDDNKTSNIRTAVFLSGIGICFTILIKAGNALF